MIIPTIRLLCFRAERAGVEFVKLIVVTLLKSSSRGFDVDSG